MISRMLAIACLVATLTSSGGAQGIRERIRRAPRSTVISEGQASDLTLTLTPTVKRPIQVWVRTAGSVDAARHVITVYLTGADAAAVKVEQRARAFPVESRSSMYQAGVTRVTPERGRTRVDVTLRTPAREGVSRYVVEIVTDRGEFLSVPNEAIIEEGTRRVVYVQREQGHYEPQEITTGIQGELFTQVLGGVNDGDQVVTFGSFFIDSEFKLKGTAQPQ